MMWSLARRWARWPPSAAGEACPLLEAFLPFLVKMKFLVPVLLAAWPLPFPVALTFEVQLPLLVTLSKGWLLPFLVMLPFS